MNYVHGPHNLKFGGTVAATKLKEEFTLGLTDPTLNSPCVDADGAPVDDTTLVSDSQCADAGFDVNPDFVAGLVPYDLSRGGGLFQFNGDATIKQQAFYAQDDIKAGHVLLQAGRPVRSLRRVDQQVAGRAAPGRVVCDAALEHDPARVIRPDAGNSLQREPGARQLRRRRRVRHGRSTTAGRARATRSTSASSRRFGRWVVVDVGYFYKHTTNGYDFGTLFDTPIFFPVSWDHSKLDGLIGRVTLVDHGGFSAFTVLGHTNAIFTPPGTGGILLEQPEGTFRIDHDQKFQQTTNLQYVFNKPLGAWAALSWRYDSGLVAGAVPDYATALTLTADQQAAIGLFCGSTFASLGSPITECDSTDRGAKRMRIPADGTEDDLNNPPRIAPRHLFDVGIGADNLLHTDRAKLRVRLSVVNLTNKEALYNFLSTFSGTHFVTPRAVQFQAGVTF